MEWTDNLAYIIATVAVILIEAAVKRFTGHWIPPKLKRAGFALINTLLLGWLKQRSPDSTDCFKRKPPATLPPPRTLGTISAMGLMQLLAPYGIKMYCTVDADYELPPRSEYIRFLKAYKDPLEYTTDNYDCDKFAWVMRAEVIKWSKGKIPFGYMEAAGAEEGYKYPNHGFCFFVDNTLQVYYVDELEVAGPKDDGEPAHMVKCNVARV